MNGTCFRSWPGVYAALGPWVEALLRVIVALCLIPHGLRVWLRHVSQHRHAGQFAEDAQRRARPRRLSAGHTMGAGHHRDRTDRRARCWRSACSRDWCRSRLSILLVLSVIEHIKDGWFWNTLGVEYPLIWAAASLYFLVYGGGEISLDAIDRVGVLRSTFASME